MRSAAYIAVLVVVGCHAVSGLDEFAVGPRGSGGDAASGGNGGGGDGGAGGESGGAGGTAGGGGTGGAGAAGGSTGDCLLPLRDDFTSELDPGWDPWGPTVGVSNDALELGWPGGSTSHSGLLSIASQNLLECAMAIELVFPPPTGGTQAFLYAQATTTDRAGFRVGNGNLVCVLTLDNVDDNRPLTFDPTAHRWWRLRESSGTLYWETSPDATSWTIQHERPTPTGVTLDLSSVPINLGGGAFQATAPAGRVTFDNFNTPP